MPELGDVPRDAGGLTDVGNDPAPTMHVVDLKFRREPRHTTARATEVGRERANEVFARREFAGLTSRWPANATGQDAASHRSVRIRCDQ